MRSANAKAPAPAVAESGRLEVCQAGERDKLSNGTTSTKTQVASIPTGRSSQVRVHLRKWHDITKIEIAHFTATVPGCLMQSGAGVSIDIELLPALIEAIVAVERQAIERGLLPNGRAAK